ncbi:MAG: phenylalanine--tRNA ligase subunit beta, partial [Defluviitaleaceae bacterium]|nr:phenylalanine--tRNA ligase subunit beta [Defluviitaleaceae bacterium]
PEIQLKEEARGQASDYVTVEIKDTARCPRYIARVVTDVQIGPSPSWLRRRLTMAGIRPINNIVDITNYVMLEYGQPLHAFDITAVARKDNKHNVVVRTASEGDKFTTLDGVERTLSGTTLLIADHEKPIGIAGIMGGENSCITEDTKIILFESANFDPANIRQSARKLGMRTDASARYEKGLDPNLSIISANRAMELIEELGCGKVAPGVVDVYPTPRVEQTILFKPANIKQLLGLDNLSANDICAYLSRVGIKTGPSQNNGEYNAVIPTYRADITGEADLAEEVGRFYGLNNIPSRYVQWVDGEQVNQNTKPKTSPENAGSLGMPTTPPPSRLMTAVKQAAVALGYYEAKTFPFESPKVFDKLLLPQDHEDRNHLALKNPLGEDMGIMRTLPINGLLESLGRNYNNNNEAAYLFEIAKTYHPKALPLTELPYEPYFLTLAAYGPDIDFLSIKGDVEELLSSINITNIGFARHQLPYTHPGYTALIQTIPARGDNSDPAPIGYLAQVHPQVCQNYQIETTAYIAVLCMEALSQLAFNRRSFTVPSVFPAMTRDLALVVSENVTAAEVETAIRERGGQLLAEVKLFDVYQGPQIEAGYKSMAYALKFRAKDRTLTDKEAQKAMRSIIDNLTKKLNAQVRDK